MFAVARHGAIAILLACPGPRYIIVAPAAMTVATRERAAGATRRQRRFPPGNG